MNKITIRPYAPADLHDIIDLFKGSVRKVAVKDYSKQQVMVWAPDEINLEHWREKYTSEDTSVAMLNSTIAGFYKLDNDGYIDMFFVHSDYQRRGIARHMMDCIIKTAKEANFSKLYSEVSLTAEGFFERFGFKTIARQTVIKGQTSFINTKMEKQV